MDMNFKEVNECMRMADFDGAVNLTIRDAIKAARPVFNSQQLLRLSPNMRRIEYALLLKEAARRMAEAADAMARRMGEGAEQAMAGVTGQMSSLVETLRTMAEQSRSAGAEAGRELADRLEAAASGFERSAQTSTLFSRTNQRYR